MLHVVTVFGTLVVCLLCFDRVECFVELIAPWAGSVFSAIAAGSICRFKECCTDEYIPGDLNLLQSSLEAELYDQHLADEIVRKALEHHIHNEKPKKALAMSFHGAPGTGKNHMVNLIVDALYKNGAKSNYVHHYNGYMNFHAKNKVAEYENQIEEDIKKHLGSCPRSIFIFDNIDSMPNGILDILMQFLDYNPRVLSVDPTESIFIFVTNVGAGTIEKQLIKLWEGGTKREDTKVEDFESLLAKDAYQEESGFHETEIIRMNFVDYHVPFLPLEERHVKKCAHAVLKNRDFGLKKYELNEIIDEAMTHMNFGPYPYNLFSESGCKLVQSKVSAIVERSRFTNPSIP